MSTCAPAASPSTSRTGSSRTSTPGRRSSRAAWTRSRRCARGTGYGRSPRSRWGSSRSSRRWTAASRGDAARGRGQVRSGKVAPCDEGDEVGVSVVGGIRWADGCIGRVRRACGPERRQLRQVYLSRARVPRVAPRHRPGAASTAFLTSFY